MTGPAWIGDATGRGALAPQPTIDVHDRGLLHGFGLFETVRCVGGQLPLWPRHMARMAASAADLALPRPPADALRTAAHELLAAGGMADGIVRVTLTAGAVEPRFVLTLRARVDLGRPLRLALVSARRGADDPTARHKSLSRLFWVIAQREAEAAGADEALVLDARGHAAETTTGNLFVELDAGWVTPPADGAILPGVARQVLLEGLAERGIAVAERPVEVLELRQARRLAVTNAVHGPRSVGLWGAGPAPDPGALAGPWSVAMGVGLG